MRELRPTGVPVQLNGVERHFLFTLNVIDEIQSHYNMTVINALEKIFDPNEESKATRFFVHTLLSDELEREKWRNPESDLNPINEKEVGWLINRFNIDEIRTAILAAYRISMPEAEDDDPNQMSGQQSN